MIACDFNCASLIIDLVSLPYLPSDRIFRRVLPGKEGAKEHASKKTWKSIYLGA